MHSVAVMKAASNFRKDFNISVSDCVWKVLYSSFEALIIPHWI